MIFFLHSEIKLVTPLKYSISTTEKNKYGVILLWTKTFYIKRKSQDIQCGKHTCKISRNRTLLPRSDIIVFNVRFTKGNNILPYQGLIRANCSF